MLSERAAGLPHESGVICLTAPEVIGLRFGQYIEVGRMDDLGRMDSPIHRLDARAKILATAAFVLVVMSFPRYEVSGLMPLFAYPFAMIAAGNIPAGYLFKKVAVASPFALFVGMFNPLLDSHPIGMIGPVAVSGGWYSFASIMVRFTLTVSAALALVACTGIHRLCAGLERLGLPSPFVVQLLFLYRYFFVIGDEGLRMLRAVEMRSAGPRPLKFQTYGLLIGHLLVRSMDRAQRIYRSMVSRGFDGEVRLLRHEAPGWKDLAFACGWTGLFACARTWDLADLVGRWLSRCAS